ncbi:MAG: hypothetical protein ACR2GX_09570 [Candidatus Dormibacteria bacterium]
MAAAPAAPVADAPDRIVFPARRPTALVVPLALITEVAGVLSILNNAPIGWFIVAAPWVALVVTGLGMRPSLALTREGLLQRQYPFSSLTRWDLIAGIGLTRAGNRTILAYRLAEGTRPPRRQPVANLLRAADRPFDGGYFADSLVEKPEVILATVERYLADPALRETLPDAKR